jgi:glutaryl-CoA dehydrogenase
MEIGVLKMKEELQLLKFYGQRNNVWQLTLHVRDKYWAMGIIGDYSIMRHMMNLESVITYEGTHDIHLLITGMDITGIPALNSIKRLLKYL